MRGKTSVFLVCAALVGLAALGSSLPASANHASLAALGSSLPAYTNHAGLAVAGVPVGLGAKTVQLSNACETVSVPLAIFPSSEQRRLAADFGSTRFVPRDVRLALDGLAERVRRADARFAKELITREEHDDFLARAAAARKAYLDGAVRSGVISERERSLLAR